MCEQNSLSGAHVRLRVRRGLFEIKLYERNSEPSPRGAETNGRRIVSLLDCLRLAVQSTAVWQRGEGGAAALQVQRNTLQARSAMVEGGGARGAARLLHGSSPASALGLSNRQDAAAELIQKYYRKRLMQQEDERLKHFLNRRGRARSRAAMNATDAGDSRDSKFGDVPDDSPRASYASRRFSAQVRQMSISGATPDRRQSFRRQSFRLPMQSSAELQRHHTDSILKRTEWDDDGIGEDGREEWYSEEALAARSALRSNPLVLAAIREAWKTILQCSEVAGQVEAGQPNMLSMDAYFTSYRKLYLMQAVVLGDVNVEAEDCAEIAEEDWVKDSQGNTTIDETTWSEGWFEWLDMHTDSIDASEYVTWSKHTIQQITRLERLTPAKPSEASKEGKDAKGGVGDKPSGFARAALAGGKRTSRVTPEMQQAQEMLAEEEEQKLLARGAVPSRRVWRKDSDLLRAIAESPEGKEAGLGVSGFANLVDVWEKQVAKVEQESKSRARASAAKALLSRSKPPKSPATVSGVVEEEEEEDTSFHSHAGDESRRGSMRALRRSSHDTPQGSMRKRGSNESSPQGSSPGSPVLSSSPTGRRNTVFAPSTEFKQREQAAYDKAITRKMSVRQASHEDLELLGGMQGRSMAQTNDPAPETAVPDGGEHEVAERNAVASHSTDHSEIERQNRRSRTANGAMTNGNDSDPDANADDPLGRTAVLGSERHESHRLQQHSSCSGTDVSLREGEALYARHRDGSMLDNSAADGRPNRVRHLAGLSTPDRISPDVWQSDVLRTGAGAVVPTADELAPPPPIVRLRSPPALQGDAAIARLRELIGELDALPTTSRRTQTSPLRTQSPRVDVQKRARTPASARGEAEYRGNVRARAEFTQALAARCPSPAPRPPQTAPPSSRARRTPLRDLKTQPPTPRQQSWPLPVAMVDSWVLSMERKSRLTKWWADEGARSSSSSATFPVVLDTHALAMDAFACGQLALRDGYIHGAERHFRFAASLAPQLPTVRWRLRDVEYLQRSAQRPQTSDGLMRREDLRTA